MKNNKKIIFIYERRYAYSSDSKLMGLDYYKSKGYDIEVWSLANWTFNRMQIDMPDNIDNSSTTIYIDNIEIFIENIKRIEKEKCFFLIYPYHAYNVISFNIRKLITESGFKFINITESDCTYVYSKISNLNLFFHYIYIDIKNIVKLLILFFINNEKFTLLFKNIYAKKLGVKKFKSIANIISTDSELFYLPTYSEAISRNNIFTHNEVFDDWKETNYENKFGNFIVYIDQGLSANDDFNKNYNGCILKNKELFFKDLISLFDILSRDFKCEIIVAMHPKSMYCGNEFGKYKIIKGETNNLIKFAKLVLIEFSTCLGQVILNKKPYINLFRNEYFNKYAYLKSLYYNIKRNLSCRQLDYSNYNNIINYSKFINYYNKNIYNNFIQKFILSKRGESIKSNPCIIEEIISKNI